MKMRTPVYAILTLCTMLSATARNEDFALKLDKSSLIENKVRRLLKEPVYKTRQTPDALGQWHKRVAELISKLPAELASHYHGQVDKVMAMEYKRGVITILRNSLTQETPTSQAKIRQLRQVLHEMRQLDASTMQELAVRRPVELNSLFELLHKRLQNIIMNEWTNFTTSADQLAHLPINFREFTDQLNAISERQKTAFRDVKASDGVIKEQQMTRQMLVDKHYEYATLVFDTIGSRIQSNLFDQSVGTQEIAYLTKQAQKTFTFWENTARANIGGVLAAPGNTRRNQPQASDKLDTFRRSVNDLSETMDRYLTHAYDVIDSKASNSHGEDLNMLIAIAAQEQELATTYEQRFMEQFREEKLGTQMHEPDEMLPDLFNRLIERMGRTTERKMTFDWDDAE